MITAPRTRSAAMAVLADVVGPALVASALLVSSAWSLGRLRAALHDVRGDRHPPALRIAATSETHAFTHSR